MTDTTNASLLVKLRSRLNEDTKAKEAEAKTQAALELRTQVKSMLAASTQKSKVTANLIKARKAKAAKKATK